MSTINHCETALLMLLTEGDAYPYQIEKIVQERDMRYWTELSMSSIYKTLRQLEKKDLVTSVVGLSEKNVGRKTYSITSEGREIISRTLLGFLAEPEKERWRIDLATSHLGLLDPGDIAAALLGYEAEVVKLIEGYKALDGYLVESGCPEHARALAIRPRYRYEAELAWVRDYRSRLGLANTNTKAGG